MTDYTLDDLVDEAGDTASEAAESGQSTGEWVKETMELLDKRGLLEPMLFGPEGAEKVQQQVQADAEAAAEDRADEGDGLDLDAEGIAAAGESIMAQLGEDVTVAEVVEICEDNPALVNKQIQENL